MDSIRTFFQKFNISSGGVNDTLNGQIYQVDVILFLLQKAKLDFQNYALSTELVEFECFDDAVLKAENFGVLAVQAKWSKTPKDLNFQAFFDGGNFLLYKYFVSLKNLSGKCPDINNVIICTSNTLPDVDLIQLSSNQSKVCVSKVDTDSIFKPFKRYKLGSFDPMENQETLLCLKAQFMAYEIWKFLKNIRNNQNFNLVILKSYKTILFDKIIDVSNNKFKSSFVNQAANDPFLESIKEALTDKKVKLNSNLERLIDSINAAHPDDVTELEMDQLLQTFMTKFELIVDLKRSDLEKEIVPILQQEFNLKNVKSIRESLQCKMIEWITNLDKKKMFSSDRLNQLNTDVKNNLTSVRIIERTARIFLRYSNIEFSNINQDFQNFIEEDPNRMLKRILFCRSISVETFLTCLQFYQILKRKYLDTFMFLQTSGPSEHFDEAVKIFDDVRSFKVLVIEVDRNPQIFSGKKSIFFEIIARKKSKKLVIISSDNMLCSNEPTVDYKKDKHYKLDDLSDDSKKEFLAKSITFQDKQVQIGSIIPKNIMFSIPLINALDCKSIGQNVISNDVYKTSKLLYIPRQLKSSNAVILENAFLSLNGNGQDFLIIVNNAGMGKTSLLNHLAEQLKYQYSDHWIINIALNNHTKYFQQNLFANPESIVDFLLNDYLKLDDPFAEALFREAFTKVGNVQIILDGLDEIAPNYAEPVMTMMKCLQSLPIRKIIVSTRPELGDRLERKFKKEQFEILPFTKEEQESFLVSCWKGRSRKSEADLRTFSLKLLDSINDAVADEDFTGIPLTIKLIAEIYMDQAQIGHEVDKIEGATNLYDLFNKLLQEKIKIICDEKIGAETSKVQPQLTMKNEKTVLVPICQRLSLPILFTAQELKLFPRNDYRTINADEFLMVLKYGLVTGSLGSEKFIHKTIAEFFGLLYLLSLLCLNQDEDRDKYQEEIFIFFVRMILIENRFQVIRQMFDSCLKDPSEESKFKFHIKHFSSTDDLSSALCVACSEGNSKTVEILFQFLIDIEDPQELIKFQKSLTERNSFLIPYFKSVDDEIGILDKIMEKFGIEFVKEIFRTKFDCEDGTQCNILSLVLLEGKSLVNLLNFFSENLLDDPELTHHCFCQADISGSNFIQKIFNQPISQKLDACKSLLKIHNSGQVNSTVILDHFRDHLNNSDPENSLLLDALKVGDIETFKLLDDFVDDPSIFPKIFSKLLIFYLGKFDDQFNVLQLLRHGLNPDPVERSFESIKILFDHFPEDSRSLLRILVAQNASGGNFLATILDPNTTEDQFNHHIDYILQSKKLLDFDVFEMLIFNLFEEWIQDFLNIEEKRAIEYLDFLKVQFGLKFIGKILKLKNCEGLTFWSHAFFNRKFSSSEEIKFGSLLEDILAKICGNELDLGTLKSLALDLIFGRENFELNFNEVFFEIGVLAKADDEVKFSDPSFLNYFGLEGFLDHLKENYEMAETVELCTKLLNDQSNFDEICWLIEKFYLQKLNATKGGLHHFTKIGDQTSFFFYLDILINQLKSDGNSEAIKKLLFSQDEEKKSFMHNFCEYERKWSEDSFERLFNKLGELKKRVPENEFKLFLLYRDSLGHTFLHWLYEFNLFEIAFNFLHSEFGIDFLRNFLLTGENLLWIQSSKVELSKVLNLFKNNFDKDFVKEFLMRKDDSNKNFLLSFNDYAEPITSADLLKLFDSILSICGADSELFNDLFCTRSRDDRTFFMKLKENYRREKLKLITDWIEKNLGHDFHEDVISKV